MMLVKICRQLRSEKCGIATREYYFHCDRLLVVDSSDDSFDDFLSEVDVSDNRSVTAVLEIGNGEEVTYTPLIRSSINCYVDTYVVMG